MHPDKFILQASKIYKFKNILITWSQVKKKKRFGSKDTNFPWMNSSFLASADIILLTQYCAVDKTEKNEMGGACDTYGGRERCAKGFGGETWEKETIGETKT